MNELPETLDETYERTLQEIDEQNWEFAHRLFQCVAVASRPLLVEELAELLAFDFDAEAIPTFLPNWRPEDPGQAVLSTCSSLLSIVNALGCLVIQFSHFSVKEYLMSPRLSKAADGVSRFYVSMADAHTIVAQACLGCLLHLGEKVSVSHLQKFPLAEYAARNWIAHARFENVAESMQDGLKRLFDERRPHFAVWVWIYDPRAPWRRARRSESPCQPKGSPLHYAALCGLHDTVKFLIIERSQDANTRGFDDNETPLSGASREGHLKVAEVLLELGADVKAQDKDNWTALHVASAYGHIKITRMLLEHGADVKALDLGNRTALHRASERGHLGIVAVLVEHGADTNASDKDGRTPLHRATEGGHLDVARVLLEHGADVMIQDNDFWTPLDRAASRGDVKVARILLEHGADAAAKDDEHGADANARDILDRAPLHRAAEEGHLELALVLLRGGGFGGGGADAGVKDRDGKTPLHWAAERGHLAVARLLLCERAADADADADVDANARDGKGRTPLHVSSRAGHLEVVRLLLACGAEVHVANDEGRTAFQEASARGWEDVVQLLWEHGGREYPEGCEIGVAL